MYDLTSLRTATNNACELAFEKRFEIGGAVNWGDLKCWEARRYENDSGEVGYSVAVEEASSSASALMLFIVDALQKAGFEDIEVRLDW